jgi:hypothetical protein
MSNKKLSPQELLETEAKDCMILFSIPFGFIIILLLIGFFIKLFS